MQLSHIFVIGIPTDSVWSLGNIFEQDGKALGVVLTVTSAEATASEVGKALVESLTAWFSSATTITAAAQFFSEFSVPESVSIACAYIDHDQAVFSATHGAQVRLARDHTITPLVPTEGQVTCVQGTLHAGDEILLGTSEFIAYYANDIFSGGNARAQLEKLAHAASVQSQPGLCGCLLTMEKRELEKREVVTHLPAPVPIPLTKPTPAPVRTPMRPHRRQTAALWIAISRQRLRLVAAGCLLLLIIAAFFFVQRAIVSRRERRIQAAILPFSLRLEEVTRGGKERVEQEQLLFDLLQDIEQANTNAGNDPAVRAQLASLTEEIRTQYQTISRQVHLEHLPVFYDFRLITADFVATQVAYDHPGKLAIFLDSNRSRMVSLALENKQPQTLSISSEIGSIQALSVLDRKAYVLGEKGVFQVSLPLDTAGKVLLSASDTWQQPKRIGNFADNLYVLDQGARQLFRYPLADPSASPSAWLRGKEGVEFDTISSLAIDGDVWMGTTQGAIYRFTRGERVRFVPTDLRTPPDSSVHVYTSGLVDRLYILEPRAQRILVLEKDGRYVSAISSPDLATATSLVVDEELGKLYVLAGSLVYEVEL